MVIYSFLLEYKVKLGSPLNSISNTIFISTTYFLIRTILTEVTTKLILKYYILGSVFFTLLSLFSLKLKISNILYAKSHNFASAFNASFIWTLFMTFLYIVVFIISLLAWQKAKKQEKETE